MPYSPLYYFLNVGQFLQAIILLTTAFMIYVGLTRISFKNP